MSYSTRRSAAVGRALDAFEGLSSAADEDVSRFYEGFAERLEDDAIWSRVQAVNDADVEDAKDDDVKDGEESVDDLADEF